jgi:hypothetical protein
VRQHVPRLALLRGYHGFTHWAASDLMRGDPIAIQALDIVIEPGRCGLVVLLRGFGSAAPSGVLHA